MFNIFRKNPNAELMNACNGNIYQLWGNKAKKVRNLLKKGADPMIKNKYGRTAFSVAVTSSAPSQLEILLKHKKSNGNHAIPLKEVIKAIISRRENNEKHKKIKNILISHILKGVTKTEIEGLDGKYINLLLSQCLNIKAKQALYQKFRGLQNLTQSFRKLTLGEYNTLVVNNRQAQIPPKALETQILVPPEAPETQTPFPSEAIKILTSCR